jgi:hypothetical protein
MHDKTLMTASTALHAEFICYHAGHKAYQRLKRPVHGAVDTRTCAATSHFDLDDSFLV